MTDWVEVGLLANPEFWKTTANGSDPRVFPPGQRRLFTKLLLARQRSPLKRVPMRTLVRPVLAVWLADNTVVGTRQAKRAWSTHAKAVGVSTAARRKENARRFVERIAHPSASYQALRTAMMRLEESERTRQPDWGKVEAAVAAVASPWPALPGVPRIERGLGAAWAPVTTAQLLALRRVTFDVTRKLAAETIREEVLHAAREVHRTHWADYNRSMRPVLHAAPATRPLAERPETVEGQIIEELDAFVDTLGGEMGLLGPALRDAARRRA
ncbi:hypothetical protein AB0442_22890 [Kitasatospora sp. NPDC085895]|uniref:hypothetical protein n=1 Tax=Kitasatospora sp. NPDC085895 TaxID=3155057 RepID=UPI00344E4220